MAYPIQAVALTLLTYIVLLSRAARKAAENEHGRILLKHKVDDGRKKLGMYDTKRQARNLNHKMFMAEFGVRQSCCCLHVPEARCRYKYRQFDNADKGSCCEVRDVRWPLFAPSCLMSAPEDCYEWNFNETRRNKYKLYSESKILQDLNIRMAIPSPVTDAMDFMVEENGHLVRLGRGAFGFVLKAQFKNFKVAVKITNIWLHAVPPAVATQYSRSTLKEAQVLARLSNLKSTRYIIHQYGWHSTRTRSSIFAPQYPSVSVACVTSVMEFAPGGDFGSWQQLYPRQIYSALGILISAMEGTLELHREGLVHMDMKEDNILVFFKGITQEPFGKIADLGHVGEEGECNAQGFIAAPEVRSDPKNCSFKADVFSFGVILGRLVDKFTETDGVEVGKSFDNCRSLLDSITKDATMDDLTRRLRMAQLKDRVQMIRHACPDAPRT